jgi:hypothetical protein
MTDMSSYVREIMYWIYGGRLDLKNAMSQHECALRCPTREAIRQTLFLNYFIAQ